MDTVLLRRIISTLDTIEVRGRENMGSLLGCIEALEGIVQAEEKAQAVKQEEADGR